MQLKWRRRGLELLFEFYTRHKGTAPDELCKQLGISVGWGLDWLPAGTYLPLFGGRLSIPRKNSRRWRIALGHPTQLFEWAASFIIGHELGHYCLLSHDVDAYLPDEVTKASQHQEMECWCDGFSIALLFSNHGIEILSIESYVEFLMGGISEDACSNVFQGERILQLCEDHFVDPPQGLFLLGDALVRAEEIQKRLDGT